MWIVGLVEWFNFKNRPHLWLLLMFMLVAMFLLPILQVVMGEVLLFRELFVVLMHVFKLLITNLFMIPLVYDSS